MITIESGMQQGPEAIQKNFDEVLGKLASAGSDTFKGYQVTPIAVTGINGWKVNYNFGSCKITDFPSAGYTTYSYNFNISSGSNIAKAYSELPIVKLSEAPMDGTTIRTTAITQFPQHMFMYVMYTDRHDKTGYLLNDNSTDISQGDLSINLQVVTKN